MTTYLSLKLVHVISATLLLGTGLGTAFFLWAAVRSGDRGAIRVTARNAIIADWIFTTPAVVDFGRLPTATVRCRHSFTGCSVDGACWVFPRSQVCWHCTC